jgi:hypothetical protein
MTGERSLLAAFPLPLLEALAAHEKLRKLGFTPDQIFIHQNPPPLLDIAVVLRHQGKQFAITVGQYAAADWLEKWKELVELFNSKRLPESELNAFYESSITGSNHVSLLLALDQKGIRPPGGSN